MDLQKCLEDIGELAAGTRVICDIYNQISRSMHKADFMVEKLVLQTSSLYGNQVQRLVCFKIVKLLFYFICIFNQLEIAQCLCEAFPVPYETYSSYTSVRDDSEDQGWVSIWAVRKSVSLTCAYTYIWCIFLKVTIKRSDITGGGMPHLQGLMKTCNLNK